jgi:hypothetical protein
MTQPLFADCRTHRPDFTESDYTIDHLRPELEALADRAGLDRFERARLSIVLDALERMPDELSEYIEEKTEEDIEYLTKDLRNKTEAAQEAVEIAERRQRQAEQDAIQTVVGGLPKVWATVPMTALSDTVQKQVKKIAAEHRRYPSGPRFIVMNYAWDTLSVFSIGDLVQMSDSFGKDDPNGLRIVRGYKC